jgi:ABC-type proline/glycine betaine transport system permease subunit
MSTLDSYALQYEDLTHKKPERVGRPEMTKSTINEQPKAVKKYAKTRGEHYKDIVIAILITAIIAFGLGVKVQADRNAQIASAVKSAVTPTATAAEASK